MTPRTLKECFEALDILLPPDIQKELVESTDEKYMIGFHHGLGRYIRNNWGLWQGSQLAKLFNTLGIEHPDDMSGIILDSYWRLKHNKPLDIEGQIKYYQDYWSKKNETTG